MLPEVSLEEVQQITLYEANKKSSRWTQSIEWLPAMIELKPSNRVIAIDSADFKGANAFKRLIDNRIDKSAKSLANRIKDFTYKSEGSEEVIPQKEIRDWFFKEYSTYPIETRKQIIRDRIKRQLSSLIDSSIPGCRDGKSIHTEQEIESILGHYFKNWTDSNTEFKDFSIWYFNLLMNFSDIGKSLCSAFSLASNSACLWNTYFSMLSLNDFAILFYASHKIQGETKKYKHIVIDEAQYLNPIWLEAISNMQSELSWLTSQLGGNQA